MPNHHGKHRSQPTDTESEEAAMASPTPTTASPATVLVVGAHGIIGRAVTEHLTALPGWNVTTASRRGPVDDLFNGQPAPTHVSVDLLDGSAAKALGSCGGISHLVYAAYTERATMAATTAPNVAMLRHTLDGLRRAGAPLEHVVLIGGGKSYGEHLGRYKTPAKESDPRVLGPIFYNEQEDLLWDRAAADGFTWTVLRPDGIFGPCTRSPMNMLTSLAAFAAICRHQGIPLRFPGSPGAWTALHQTTDAELLARAVDWALTADPARGEAFNVTNGDHFRWQHLWPDLAEHFSMPIAAPQPMSLTEQMSDKEEVWNSVVARHGLRATPWQAVASWPFVDGWLSADFDMVQSTIKIRQAGFAACVDTHESLRRNLTALRTHRYLP